MNDLSSELVAVLAALEEPIDFEGLTKRAVKVLHAKNITTFYDLCQFKQSEISEWPHFGRSAVLKVRLMVEKRGLHLGMDIASILAEASAKGLK